MSEPGLDFYSYQASINIALGDPPFYALIAAAMRRADSGNLAKLETAWPQVRADLDARYNAPGGVLPTDPAALREKVLGDG